MLSQNIKDLRNQSGLTQKELAEKLHVTSQAISRWENGDVEPSVSTIGEMANIFGVSTDEIIGGPDKKPAPEVVTNTETEYVVKEHRPVLAVCELCNQPIYDANSIIRNKQYNHCDDSFTKTNVVCSDCDAKMKEKIKQEAITLNKKRRVRSFVWPSIITALVLFFTILGLVGSGPCDAGTVLVACAINICVFTFSACMFLQNTWAVSVFFNVAEWGFVKFPGVIFEFSLDGFLWLIGIKLLFWALGLLLGLLAVILAFILSSIISPFTYPLALIRNFKHPEVIYDFD